MLLKSEHWDEQRADLLRQAAGHLQYPRTSLLANCEIANFWDPADEGYDFDQQTDLRLLCLVPSEAPDPLPADSEFKPPTDVPFWTQLENYPVIRDEFIRICQMGRIPNEELPVAMRMLIGKRLVAERKAGTKDFFVAVWG